jgi:hypothetical protein
MTVRRLALIGLGRMIVVVVMIGVFLFVSRTIDMLVHAQRLLAEFGGQQRAVSGDDGSLQGIRSVFLFQGIRKCIGGCVAQMGVLADSFQQINRIRHVFPLFRRVQTSRWCSRKVFVARETIELAAMAIPMNCIDQATLALSSSSSRARMMRFGFKGAVGGSTTVSCVLTSVLARSRKATRRTLGLSIGSVMP